MSQCFISWIWQGTAAERKCKMVDWVDPKRELPKIRSAVNVSVVDEGDLWNIV